MANQFYIVKQQIKEEIIQQHGNFTAFLTRHPEMNLTNAKLSMILNPASNATLKSLENILRPLNMDITIRKKIKIKLPEKAS